MFPTPLPPPCSLLIQLREHPFGDFSVSVASTGRAYLVREMPRPFDLPKSSKPG